MNRKPQENHPLLAHIGAVRDMIAALPKDRASYQPLDLSDAFTRVDPALEHLDKTRKDLRSQLRKLSALYDKGEPMLDLVADELEEIERAYIDRLVDLRHDLVAKKKAMKLLSERKQAEETALREREEAWRERQDAERAAREELAKTQAPEQKPANGFAGIMAFLIMAGMLSSPMVRRRPLRDAFHDYAEEHEVKRKLV